LKVVVIGGSGHIGTYLIPRLVEEGHVVTNVSRSERQPYQQHAAWSQVTQVVIDRTEAEAKGEFGSQIAALGPDIVIDLICFTLPSATQIVNALKDRLTHFLHCGTIWVHGPSAIVPTTEDQPRRPFGEYGLQKAAIEDYLLTEARLNDFPATLLHPGHIVGPGWEPVNPAGNFNLSAFEKLAHGQEFFLPNLGLETVHHVHADDVAQAFMKAIEHRAAALGESFHVVSPAALTLRGYAEAVAGWFGMQAFLKFQPWAEWKAEVNPQDAAATWDHISHSPNCSIAKAFRSLDYQPRYTSLQAVKEAVEWLIAAGRLKI
jgi:nucleoside-diphosphate-sugar epimerase